MPTGFQDRERAYEAKFAHDQAFRFRTIARRDKLFARWAAIRMGLSEEAADALVKDVLTIPDKRGHDEALLDHIAAILSARGAVASEEGLAAALSECMKQALRQLAEAGPDHSALGRNAIATS
jgi:hypothetical protein